MMRPPDPVRTVPLMVLVIAAVGFWVIIFGLKIVNFWLGMAVAASTLAGASVLCAGMPVQRADLRTCTVIMGLVSAGLLYGIFAVGDTVAAWLFAFAKPQVAAIHTIREQGPVWIIALVLALVTSPAEEIFWRGFVQRGCVERLGAVRGVVAGALIYGGVHLCSGNVMLTAAALVAGLFWGVLYQLTHNLIACILSHAVWTVSVFVIWPIGR